MEDIYQMDAKCVCQHEAKHHIGGMCWACQEERDDFWPHDFKLDNLRFIEDEAKRRNLIN